MKLINLAGGFCTGFAGGIVACFVWVLYDQWRTERALKRGYNWEEELA